MTASPSPWFADPMGRARYRRWDGRQWTTWLSDGITVWEDPRPVRRRLVPADVTGVQFVDEFFLPEAKARGLVGDGLEHELRTVLTELYAEATTLWNPVDGAVPSRPSSWGPAPAAMSPPASAAGAPYAQRPAPSSGPSSQPPGAAFPGGARPAPTTARPVPGAPSPAVRRWRAVREATGSAVALHGLAYLGVLLLFVGVFGLVAFAFGDVTPSMRPVAELASAVVPFLAAWWLRRHDAVVVGRGLEVVGALLLPVLLVTSAVDGFPFPPDPRGAALVVSLVAACLLTAVAYAAWSVRVPTSGLRHAAAPAIWLGAAMATLGAGRPIPTGQDVAVPSAVQAAAMAAALALTVGVARLKPQSLLGRATLTSALPGGVVIAVLVVLTWTSDGWPAGPVAVAGVSLALALRLLEPRIGTLVVDLMGPLWWASVTLALAADLPAAAAGCAGAVGFVLLLEDAGRRGRPGWVLRLPAAGLTIALLTTWAEPAVAAVGLGMATVWAVLRRAHPFPSGGGGFVSVLGAVAPAGAALALGAAHGGVVGLAAATGLVTLATIPARSRVPVLRRSDDDGYWSLWWHCGVVVAGISAALVLVGTSTSGDRWTVASVFAVLAVVSLVGPLGRVSRPWAVSVLGLAAWLVGCDVARASGLVRGLVPAVIALALVAVARRPVAAHLGLAGHTLGLITLALTGAGWGRVGVVALVTAGFALTAALDDRDRSPVGTVLGHWGPWARYLPWSLTAAGVPAVVWTALAAADAVPLRAAWAVAVPAGAAMVYASATRFALPDRLRNVLTWGGFAGALLAVPGAREQWPAIVALAAVTVLPVLLPGERRRPVVVWTAWVAVVPLAGLLLRVSLARFAALAAETQVVIVLVAIGGVLLLGATVVDTARGSWVPRWLPDRPGALAPFAVGSVAVTSGALGSIGAPEPAIGGVLLLVTGGVILATGALLRAGTLGGVAVAVAWIGVMRVAGAQVHDRPWIAVATAWGLAAAADVLHRVTTDREPSSRWDVPVLVAALPSALTALAVAADGPDRVLTYVTVGALVSAVAVRLRHRIVLAELLGWVGTGLVLLGAAWAGSGWVAVTFVALGAVHTTLALRAHGQVRTARQAIGVVAVVLAWVAALDWFAWSTQRSIDVTAVAAGTLALLAAIVTRPERVRAMRPWARVWGGAGLLVTAAAVVASLAGGADVAPSLLVVVGVAQVAAALAIAAEPLRAPVLREVAVLVGLAGLVLLLEVTDATPGVRVGVLAVLGAALAPVTLALAQRMAPAPHGQVWQRPTAELGGAAVLAALVVGLGQSSPTLVAPAVAAAAVHTAAAGVAWRSLGLQVLSPVLVCVAWFLVATQIVGGDTAWYSAPIGLTLLAIVSLWRHDLRRRDEVLNPPPVVAVELLAVAFLVGAWLVQSVTVSLLNALVAAGLGLAVAAWGVLTKVRRRVATGACVVLVAVVLLAAVPLVALLPGWAGAGVWLVVALLGIAAVFAATLLERGRTAVRCGWQRMGASDSGWE